ncbi:alpha/beta hydrolase, partial [Streptomyces sp. SID14478]|nr:alpha/beta hydrolase [Streptomyces sp. SID14478]
MTGNERGAPAQARGRGGALFALRTPPGPRAAVLFLHGGRADSRAPARPWHLAALRMRPF